MLAVQEYLDHNGLSPYADWFNSLNAPAAAKVAAAVTRVSLGNMSNVKGVGSGVFERVIDFGLGYRVYFGKDGDKPVVLLGGGTKKKQQRDIETAIKLWKDYKQRKGDIGHGTHS